ncbi:MAG: hypothetical protein EOM59_08355 [Clostridia bacterium]|nr:hypothetical protein [Clostridia bacterium]
MKIEHIALWANDIETIKDFYVKYFDAKANKKYVNESKGFQSYFVSFDDGARLEIMQMPNILMKEHTADKQSMGYIHIALALSDEQSVIELTEQLRSDGYQVVSEPRRTGDGYFESCILDPEGNRIEITT